MDYPNKVFREVKSSGRRFVEPATPAVYLIITQKIVDDYGIQNLLDELFQETKKK